MLQQLRVDPKKGLGQHFLVDSEALAAILAATQPRPDDVVLEVGPGLGILTRALAGQGAAVMAVELDPDMVRALDQTVRDYPNVRVIQGDILRVPPAEALAAAGLAGRPYKLVANLPYYITSPTLRHFLEAEPAPDRMVVTIQKAVAQRIAAKPGQLSLLAISVQLYGQPEIIATVPASSFYPPPKVDSAVLRVRVYDRPAVAVPDRERFFATVQAGFSQPRKQLHNALGAKLWLPPGGAQDALARAGIDPSRRAQTLSLDEWAALDQAVADVREAAREQA